jgi:hypothetical protein
MRVEIVTKEDLQHFRITLLNDLKEVIVQNVKSNSDIQEGYKTKQVRKILGCSNGKLQSLRIAGKLRSKKVGGTVYYNRDDVQKLITEGF